eukprot:5956094-Alexandrium_andersonii.AAC.1
MDPAGWEAVLASRRNAEQHALLGNMPGRESDADGDCHMVEADAGAEAEPAHPKPDAPEPIYIGGDEGAVPAEVPTEAPRTPQGPVPEAPPA